MRKLLVALFALIMSPVAVFADAPVRYVPLGYCQLATLTSAVGLASCSGGIPSGSTFAVIACETQDVRYRDDGTAPTASVGMVLPKGATPFLYTGALSKLSFIETTASGKLNVLFYR